MTIIRLTLARQCLRVPHMYLNRSQGEIYICLAGKIGSGAAGQFCGASLKDGATSSLDVFPTAGQIGEEAAHSLPHCGTGSLAQVGGGFLAHPSPNRLVSVEVWAVLSKFTRSRFRLGMVR